MIYEARTIDKDIEKTIITGIILSSRICNSIIPIAKSEHFANELSKTVLKWVSDYFSIYKEAPGKHIQDIFREKKSDLNSDISFMVEEFLSHLSDRYLKDGDSFNEEYILGKSIRYIKKQTLIGLADTLSRFASSDRVEDAELQIAEFKNIGSATLSDWVKPFDDMEFVSHVFEKDNDSDGLFTPHGAVGHLTGPLKRGWLVGLMGPMKRGKSWGLQDLGMDALVSRLRVAFFSLEMEKEDMAARIYKSITSSTLEEDNTRFPCFDCSRNIDNSCNSAHRPCNIPRPHSYYPGSGYIPCDWCRRNIQRSPSQIWEDLDLWFFDEKRPEFEYVLVKDAIKDFQLMFGKDKFRLKTYPAYSANLSNITADLEILEFTEGFIPDVIVVDYADIMAPERQRNQKRLEIDDTWKELKALAQRKKALVITGSQTNVDAFEADTIKEKHTAEDKMKLAHVDCFVTLNQNDSDSFFGVTRIAMLNHRHRKFDRYLQALVLQCFETGQFNLDSELIRAKTIKGRMRKKGEEDND